MVSKVVYPVVFLPQTLNAEQFFTLAGSFFLLFRAGAMLLTHNVRLFLY